MSSESNPGVNAASSAGLVLPLMAWLSPTFPVGGYAYSHGLEWAVEAGDVVDEATLVEWLMAVLQHGAGRNDAILLATAYRASQTGQDRDLDETNDLALALAPSRELRLETRQQGRSFLDAALAAWPSTDLARRAGSLQGEVAYPIAVGLAAGAYGTDLRATIEGFLFSFLQNLVSAAVRLAPIGQTAGARVLATLAPSISALARAIPAQGLDDIGSATLRADLGSFLHETQYTRLFRS
jgi:urease accessory protein